MYSLAIRNITGRAARAAVTTPRYASARLYSSFSTMHDNDAETLDAEKARNLTGSQHKTSTPIREAPGWNEHLASESEAHVKADRSTLGPQDLQRTTVDYLQARHNPEERPSSREALYTHDEVSGPLGDARVGEFEGVVGAADVDLEYEQTDVEVDPSGAMRQRTIHEEETVHNGPTPSEEAVKADRKEN
ncbi:hypothetical protein CONPUDRAFT_163215 [Coniophora puteana RWD-64-598 SS2]|uniref:Uncharacterized protein n=1 Tax=Coniophora puteana (strain RWD-64-598) TaxID=741705 RepID=A0A5M3MXW2_CONPW|nr:uncharacterized protein CONPUDRAFT_163215 [Coniophora puteana RWD-64-598 SS2]EIW83962.1 hypothetical protein CONPUDRAFT_163215 [Coniophora puteana RWD-64-598 SS2]